MTVPNENIKPELEQSVESEIGGDIIVTTPELVACGIFSRIIWTAKINEVLQNNPNIRLIEPITGPAGFYQLDQNFQVKITEADEIENAKLLLQALTLANEHINELSKKAPYMGATPAEFNDLLIHEFENFITIAKSDNLNAIQAHFENVRLFMLNYIKNNSPIPLSTIDADSEVSNNYMPYLIDAVLLHLDGTNNIHLLKVLMYQNYFDMGKRAELIQRQPLSIQKNLFDFIADTPPILQHFLTEIRYYKNGTQVGNNHYIIHLLCLLEKNQSSIDFCQKISWIISETNNRQYIELIKQKFPEVTIPKKSGRTLPKYQILKVEEMMINGKEDTAITKMIEEEEEQKEIYKPKQNMS